MYFFDFGQCIVREENGKLITESEKFTSVKEIQGDTLVEVSGLVIYVVICLIIETLESVLFSCYICFLYFQTLTAGSVISISRSKRV